MSVPQMKERPASMLRAMFASVGSLFSGSRAKRAAEPSTVAAAPAKPEATAPEAATEPEVTAEPAAPSEPVAVAEPEAATAPEATTEPEPVADVEIVVADVEVLTDPEIVAAEAEAVAEPEVVVVAESEVVTDPEIVAVVAEATAEPEAGAGAALPLANYDSLSVASLRARLRNLSAEQLAQLVEYEKGHAARADVISMFERRIAKVQAEG
jgi:hypothetical protein